MMSAIDRPAEKQLPPQILARMSAECWTTHERIPKRAREIGVRCGERWGQRHEGRFGRLRSIVAGSFGAASICPRWLAVVVVLPFGAQEGAQVGVPANASTNSGTF